MQKPRAFMFLSFRAETWPTCWEHVINLRLARIFRKNFPCADNGLAYKIPCGILFASPLCAHGKFFLPKNTCKLKVENMFPAGWPSFSVKARKCKSLRLLHFCGAYIFSTKWHAVWGCPEMSPSRRVGG